MPTCETADLSIAYEDHGGEALPALLLLHGWPDDATIRDGVAAPLVESGGRVVVRTLRGFGAKRLKTNARRTGNGAILAFHAIGFVDALGVDRFVAGHDWGSNTAEALATGWPERIGRMAMMSSPPQMGRVPTPPFEQTRQRHHWFMATERGMQAAKDNGRRFAHLHWINWSPPGLFDEATFDQVAQSWDNPDWHPVIIHSYRARRNEAAPDPDSACGRGEPAEHRQGRPAKFTDPFAAIPFPGVDHFPQREPPAATARVLVHHFSGSDPADLSSQPKDI